MLLYRPKQEGVDYSLMNDDVVQDAVNNSTPLLMQLGYVVVGIIFLLFLGALVYVAGIFLFTKIVRSLPENNSKDRGPSLFS